MHENHPPSTVNRQPSTIIWLLIIVSSFSSCAKDNTPSGDLNGVYTGIYLQTGDIEDAGSVTIVFVGSNFSGESIGSARPICNGSYQITRDSIDFKNFCSTPDPELLLVGKYKMINSGDSLYFTRDSNAIVHYQEYFSLKKQ